MPSKTVVVLVLVVVALAPKDVPPQCEQDVFRRVNPGLCSVGPLPGFPAPQGGGGGLLGGIGRILHNLTGGLL